MKGLIPVLTVVLLAGCASQAPQPRSVDAPVSEQMQQEQAQQVTHPERLILKRKLAVGRLSNETNYGRSLLRTNEDNALDKKISDIFMQSIVNTDAFLVFERPDIAALQSEANLSSQTQELIGVDTLVIGSLTEFGRANTGERGFFSSSAKQEATATVDLRIVDVKTGQVIESVTGTGSSATEQSRTMGFGSVAGYDGSLNDQAIGAAVNAAVGKMVNLMLEKPWTADILANEEGQIFISGGKAQGVNSDMEFAIATRGKRIRSSTTGAMITLPGKQVATLKIVDTFGDSSMDQGSYGTLTSGSLSGYELSDLEVTKL